MFIETLIADDDDNDLSNGTPNDINIIESFNNHHIGTDLFLAVSFSHNNLPDSQTPKFIYSAFTLACKIAIIERQVENVELVYTTDGFKTSQTLLQMKTN
jgi:hypothetical protein